MKRSVRISLGLITVSSFSSLLRTASANTLRVGPGKQYATPCAAIAAAADGDTIQIDSSGIYSGDVCLLVQAGPPSTQPAETRRARR